MSAFDSFTTVKKAILNQREAINPFTSVWVVASAGSGKTKVLIDRLLNLLLLDCDPRGLLCLTFTTAAATEISTRLLHILSKWTIISTDDLRQELNLLDNRAVSQERINKARRLFAEVLDIPGGLNIKTIHAFAHSLLLRFPLEAGITPNFSLVDDRKKVSMLDDAQRFVLELACTENDSALASALSIVTERAVEQNISDLLKTMLFHRVRLMHSLELAGGIEEIIASLHDTLGTNATDTDLSIRCNASKDNAFDRKALYDAARALEGGSKTDIKRANTVFTWLALPNVKAMALAWDDYKRAFLTQEGGILSRFATKKIQNKAASLVDNLTNEAKRILAVEEMRKALDTASRSAALIRLSVAVISAYEKAKSRSGLLDFEDLVERLRRLLAIKRKDAWVLFKLDNNLEHILIDEAQDTSSAQWEIVRALADDIFFNGENSVGDKESKSLSSIFVVGDAKQSIYSFQGADLEEFMNARSYLAERAKTANKSFRNVEMNVSFRSTAAVLRAVDAVFSYDNVNHGLSDVIAGVKGKITHQSSRIGQVGRVEIWPLIEANEKEKSNYWSALSSITIVEKHPVRRLSQIIVQRIADWLSSGKLLEAKNRLIRPGDIMILVRRRGIFMTELVRAFKFTGIPVGGVDRMVLTEHMAVRDLIALGEVILLPDDDLILATVLKSPLIGLKEEDLLDLACGRQEHRLWSELWRVANKNIVFDKAAKKIANWTIMANRLHPYDFYQQLLSTERVRERLISRYGVECNDAIDEFLNHALDYEHDNPPSLQSFLHTITSSKYEVKRQSNSLEVNQVRVMTVHGAKGLQAPIVILPDTIRAPQLRNTIIWHHDGIDIPLWLPSISTADNISLAARVRSQSVMEAEYQRLLYVAMTRAEDWLIFCGWKKKYDKIEKSWFGQAYLAMRSIAEEKEDGSLVLTTGEKLNLSQSSVINTSQYPKSLPSWAHVSAIASRKTIISRSIAPSRLLVNDNIVNSPLQKNESDQLKRGALLHRLFQVLPNLEPKHRPEAGRALISRHIDTFSHPDRIHDCLEEVLLVLNDPEFAPVFAFNSRAEVPIIGQLLGPNGLQNFSGIIDRLVVCNKFILIVDYKSNRSAPMSISYVEESYLQQMAAYRTLVSFLYPGRLVRCAFLWISVPCLMPIPNDYLQNIMIHFDHNC
ncbi:double-strand break repair helicase AddA [Candidatus Endolissoclinum faulkneri L2]|uniref:DNA 3'-5' helicase n=1 Tax=Candidatus Endolissoclinum faulkneri L2 TaxID=1193729 RepID=K7Z629_9PROT|nr:double-strand break repair helicase AddA [Candidatus Endolissoclinum faulkneri]AFX99603.1 double-strand break repair helicase AddA [Candidatus Endolissoclinum faulkneri L2]